MIYLFFRRRIYNIFSQHYSPIALHVCTKTFCSHHNEIHVYRQSLGYQYSLENRSDASTKINWTSLPNNFCQYPALQPTIWPFCFLSILSCKKIWAGLITSHSLRMFTAPLFERESRPYSILFTFTVARPLFIDRCRAVLIFLFFTGPTRYAAACLTPFDTRIIYENIWNGIYRLKISYKKNNFFENVKLAYLSHQVNLMLHLKNGYIKWNILMSLKYTFYSPGE